MAFNRHRLRRTVVAFAPRSGTLRWIDEELAGEAYKIIGVTTLADLVARLRERANQIAVVDFAEMTETDLLALVALRNGGWRGELIGLGRIESEMRTALRPLDVFMRPFGSERLRKTLSEMSVDKSTQLMPAIAPANRTVRS
jgi:hypothetical protein